MREIDELRPLSALALLTIWRETAGEAETELERSLLCNARVLAACCWFDGAPAFAGAEEVLAELTGRQMEALLGQLAEQGAGAGAENPRFDPARFRELAR